jgi:hypothetical protein
MQNDRSRPNPRVCAIGAYAAQTVRERFGIDGKVDLSDFASFVTLDAFRIALRHPEYVAAMVAEHDTLMRSQQGDAFAEAIIAAHVARVEDVVRHVPIVMQEAAP